MSELAGGPGEERRPRGRDRYMKMLPAIRSLRWGVSKLPRRMRLGLIEFRNGSDGLLSRLVRSVALGTVARESGELVDVHRGCDLLGVAKLSLGSRVSIHPKCYIDATGGVSIGNDVSIAHHTTILSTTHSWQANTLPIRDQPLQLSPTTIGDDVWIGAGVRILSGVTIGSRVIVGAGAVVTKDVPSGSLVAGVPARVIRSL